MVSITIRNLDEAGRFLIFDAQIAAIALLNKAAIASRDVADFEVAGAISADQLAAIIGMCARATTNRAGLARRVRRD